MPSILISEYTVKVNYSIRITVRYCILCETHVKCGVILEVFMSSHVRVCFCACHLIPHPHLYVRYGGTVMPYERPRQ